MIDKKKLARDFARNQKIFNSDFPYLNDIEFLTYLKDEYEAMGQLELCVIVNARIKLFTTEKITNEMIDDFNIKLELIKKINGNLN